ncbi:hypothetical protein RRG08_042091 [Elysia crispata]|uniref:Uncharacterized protein n=1 Tax=Elysia crispata TaxID=231223 RepID=A0AAE0YFB7_9GAST|nr:hypothetical protein RRG08_042091 [Elysia crispata]
MEPVIDAKGSSLISCKCDPSQSNLQALWAARSKRLHRANNYLLNLMDNIQQESDSGNIRDMYKGTSQATDKPTKKTASLKLNEREFIRDRYKQMDRALEIHVRENSVTQKWYRQLKGCPYWKSWTMNQLWRSSAKELSSGLWQST